MNMIDWIQEWFEANCDGKWEHGEGINISTLDKPGWQLEIDISKTSIANITIPWILNETGPKDWYGVEIENKKFNAAGDPSKLNYLLGLFKEMIDKIEGKELD